MKFYDTIQSVEKYLNVPLECDCGRTHFAPIKAVDIGRGAIASVPDYMKRFGYKKAYILCDAITERIVGEKLGQLIFDAGLSSHTLVIRHMGFDEATLGEIVINRPEDSDLMIGCGTGSITDMLRYSSFKLGLPCFIVATGAPMDGFSASVGIMNVNNLKATMPAHSAEVIIGDTDVLSGAPFRMTVAGYADLVGKLSSLNDWRIAAIVNNDHYCGNIDKLVTAYVNKIIAETNALNNKEPEAIGDVMDALLLSGATVSLYGSSRAISGCEHHMSHYWEVLGDRQGKQLAMHGEQVAVGTVLALMLCEELRDRRIDFNRARNNARAYDAEKWEREIVRVYGNAAEAIINLEKTAGKNAPENSFRRIDAAEKRWGEVKNVLDSAFSSKKLIELFMTLGCPCLPGDIGLTPEVVKDTFLYCKETRDRYTLYQLAWDLGLLDELSDEVIKKLNNMGAF